MVKKDICCKTGRQTFTLFSSQILALGLGILTGIINTRTLGPTDYGVFTFFFTFTGFTVLFFRFGLASSVSLLLAETKDKEKEKELIGATVVIAFFVGVAYSTFVFVSSFFVDDLFHTNVEWILRYASVLVMALPFTLFIPLIGRGTNQIGLLSMFNVIPKTIYIFSALILLNLIQIEPLHFVLLNLSGTIIGVLILLHAFSPKFSNLYENLEEILRKTKEYGFHVYLGQIANQSTYKLDGIFITLFVNTTQLGFYSLAMTMTSSMVGLSQALSTSLFKSFANLDRIPRKVFLYNFTWLILCVLGLALFGPVLIYVLFGEEFLPAAKMILPLALAGLFQGMYQPYTFLASKGKGKWIRNVAYTEMAANIVGNVFLIYLYGAFGAAVASAISKFIHWIMLRNYYNIYLRGIVT